MQTLWKPILAFLLVALAASPSVKAATKPVRVFVLAGQSNMEGHGIVAADPKRNGGRGSLEYLVKDVATAQRFAPLADSARQWRKRDDEAELANIKDWVPGSDGSYVLSGFGWHQGWNDRINDKFNEEYESNLACFIRDIRKDLGVPALPFVIAETGMSGPEENHPRALSLMKAQAAVAERPEFRGNVAFVGTRAFWRPSGESPSKQEYHWNSNAETYFLIGEAMGRAMQRLIAASPSPRVQEGEMAGYLLFPQEQVPETYNAGFSMYVAAWPLLQRYPGNRFQSGLLGTWMFAQYDGPEPQPKMYSDIEGGLGWWRDTRFATETPKFIMGGVALNFVEWANGPGAGKGRNWDQPLGQYGVVQLSPWLLWPPDGLNLQQGAAGELFGYGYLPPPTVGKLADLDPALLVTPPPGMDAGYVPIVIRQAAEE